ncbi:CIS tube protein [Aquimarina algicola]|uniref:Contractile injection system tube protein N-terminal domain-containing protein n=1 Tax=Aquimarina algicola TaxID=2589995 RepID=A0A504JCB2_9FLAO|nr:hypothetical protein [Aquimarina algicola]TPN83951.1 hypothetical protein FHK87_18475 [Aquimarina algicola]
MDDRGQLVKVLIKVYEDKEFQRPAKISPNPISLPVNPESLTKNYKVDVTADQGHGSQGTNSDFKKTPPKELKLDFIFDGTNTIQGYKYNDGKQPVKDQIDIFLAAVYNMNGSIHKPHFLQVLWGSDFNFKCVLTNLDLNYTLFKPNGDPLRVKASATFVEYLSQRERVAREGKKSPDLTHTRQIKAGDRLDNMTHDIYNKTKYVTQIARVNGLSSFRKITPGKELIFPPLDKTST